LIKIVTLHDGSALEVGLTGNPDGKVVMLPTFKKSVYGKEAEQLKAWGVDPESGAHFVEGLSDRFQVLYFDYEGHLMARPLPDTLTPGSIAQDLLRIADEMQVGVFSYYGYSWLALAGLQLALRTDRLESLIMGGYPPYEGPYKEMRTVTEKTYEQALLHLHRSESQSNEPVGPETVDWDRIQVTIDPDVAKQFHTLYQHLTEFDDTSIQEKLAMPRLTFAGEQDTIVYGPNFGSVTVDIAGRLRQNEQTLRGCGWDVELLLGAGMDHTKAMQPAAVLPLIKPWLIARLL